MAGKREPTMKEREESELDEQAQDADHYAGDDPEVGDEGFDAGEAEVAFELGLEAPPEEFVDEFEGGHDE
jgi:hypothetical protein